MAGTGRLALRLRRILAVAAVAAASLRLVVLAVPASSLFVLSLHRTRSRRVLSLLAARSRSSLVTARLVSLVRCITFTRLLRVGR